MQPNPAPLDFTGIGSVDLAAIEQFFDVGIPFNKFLGLHLVEIERGRAVAELPFRDEFIGDPVRPALHGGVISMAADTVGGAAVFTLTDPGDRVATIDLRIDYLRPGLLEDILCDARVIRMGNRVAVTAMVVRQGATDAAEPYITADGRGVYNVLRSPRPR